MLDNVILMLWPTINPDGHQMVADWYMSHVGTPRRAGAPLPSLYQEYVGHDNNRDAYMLNMIESRVMEHAWRQWEPNIIYVHHQSSPFPTRIWLPPFAEPIATHAPVSDVARGEHDRHGDRAAARGGRQGRRHAHGHGLRRVVSRATSTTTRCSRTSRRSGPRRRATAPRRATSSPTTIAPNMRRPQALYVSPWLGGTWRLRDAVEYMETASMATLDYAAKYKEHAALQPLSGRPRSDRAAAAREAPYAYFVPQDQRDPVAAVEMLRRLAFSGVRVYAAERAGHDRRHDVRRPAPGWFRPTRSSRALAREVLDVQKYPEIRESPGGPLDTPYDAAGWTLPLSMGVRTIAATTPLTDDDRDRSCGCSGPQPAPGAPLTPYNMSASADAAPFDSAPGIGFDAIRWRARSCRRPAGSPAAGRRSPSIPRENNAFRAINRAWKAGASVAVSRRAPAPPVAAT